MNISQLLIFTTFLIMITITHSQTVDYFFPGFNNHSAAANLELTDNAVIQSTGILRLTNDSRRQTGHALSRAAVRLKNASRVISFSTSFAVTVVPEYPKLGGHGLAFVITAASRLRALPSQYLGLLTARDNSGNASNHLFAVEFDTVQDFEFGDINDNHIGVNVNSMNSTVAAAAAYYDDSVSSLVNFSLNGKPIMAWIDYDGGRSLLNVTVAPFDVKSKPRVPLISHQIDLSPVFQEFMYVGFSASTGLLASSHYILGWSFATEGRARELDVSSLRRLPGPKKSHVVAAISATSLSMFLLVCISLIGGYLYWKVKNADPIEAWEFELGPHRFSYSELRKATKSFRDKELIGFGGFGRVYRGVLPKSKVVVAVKRVSHESKQGIREFVSEISTIGRLRHRNLVQLMGWCRRRGDLLLVYEYMQNGSLDKFLFRGEDDEAEAGKFRILNWEERVKIVNGIASALFYLHEGFEQVVIHRDVKASNVLLDEEMNGRLGDFGLARLHDHGTNMSTTRVVGTLGYLAPELPRTGKATTSSDVFAFGALLLEVVTGRKPIEPKLGPEELVLVDWVWEMYQDGKLVEVVDKKLGEKFNPDEATSIARLGLMCSSNAISARPTMRQVVRFLEGEVRVPEEIRDPFVDFDGRKDRRGEGFDEFCHSFPTSSFEGLSKSHSFGSNNNKNNRGAVLGASFDSLSMSPLTLLCSRE